MIYILLVLVSFANGFALQARPLTVMSYNVENLFDLENDPRLMDDEFTPEGTAEWTEEKLNQKLINLTSVVKSIRNEDGSLCPDVLGLVEVENRTVLEYWQKNFLAECGYRRAIINQHEPDQPIEDDRRGIKVALLSKLDLAGQPVTYTIYRGTRYILEVPLKLGNSTLVVLVNHWKSRIGGGEDKRILSGQTLRQIFKNWNAIEPFADVIAVGDFNDEPENESFVRGLQVQEDERLAGENLEEPFVWNTSFDEYNLRQRLEEAQDRNQNLEEVEALLRKARGTLYYEPKHQFFQFDHVLISRGLLDQQGFYYIRKSFRVVQSPGFFNEIGAPIPFSPSRRGAVGGASDHFPVLVELGY